MLSLKNKLDSNLKFSVDNKLYKNYRVLIKCSNMTDKIKNKITSYNGELIRLIPSINCICARVTINTLNRLIEYPQVEHICFDDYALLCGSSVTTANGIHRYGKYKRTGKGVSVGIVDSGVYPHPDLMNPSNKIIKFVDLINNFKYPYDDNGHGTFMSGLICGNGCSSNFMYSGIASDSKIFMIKAFNKIGKGYISDVLYSLELLISSTSEFNIKVICLPFEILNNDYFILSQFSEIFDSAVSKGIVIVVPAGNNGTQECSIRGISTLKNVITVGGLNTTGIPKEYIFSSAGPCGKNDKPDLSAACEDICSLRSDTNFIPEKNGNKIYPRHLEAPYINYTGTSCAAAYVSAVCALLYENSPKLTLKDISSMLKVSCDMKNISKWIQGWGSIDLNRLIK